MDVAEEVLGFWFAGHFDFQWRWFRPDPDFDAAVGKALLPTYRSAAEGRLWHLAANPRGALALILLLDQVPRNVFRETAQAFLTDGLALATSRFAVGLGHDRMLHPVQRLFMYLPFEHSESMVDQDRSVELYTRLGDPMAIDYAHRHRDIILRFGRFPHRNRALARPTTPDEAAFLLKPNSRF